MDTRINNLKLSIKDYAHNKQLTATERAIDYVDQALNKYCGEEHQRNRRQKALTHVLEVCSVVTDLGPAISIEEEDDLLAAILLHILPENWPIENLRGKLMDELGYSEATYNIVTLLINRNDMSHEEEKALCERIQSDRLALIAALADRGNVIQTVYEHSTWVAHRYINESKAYYLPMAIYGKEHYRELVGVMAILMEKLRTLLEVAEIFLTRFEAREAELSQDILALQEENATIRGIIADFKSGK